jgi:hypothetical protein
MPPSPPPPTLSTVLINTFVDDILWPFPVLIRWRNVCPVYEGRWNVALPVRSNLNLVSLLFFWWT